MNPSPTSKRYTYVCIEWSAKGGGGSILSHSNRHPAMTNRKRVSTADREMTVDINPDQTERSIVKLLDVCFHDARAVGFEGDRDQWEPTEADLDFVVDELGYKPTSDQWRGAGIVRVGGEHTSK